MNRRALVIAVVLALVGTTMLLLYMQRFEREMSGGEQVELLMLVKAVERGAPLTEEMLSTRSVPIAYVEDRAVKAAEKAKVVGLRTSTALQAQQSLMWTDLAITTEDRDLSSLVQPGKRAVTVRASGTEDTKGNDLIRPGDYVDVVVTMQDQNELQGTAQAPLAPDVDQKRAVVLLQKVLVLAVGLDTRMTHASQAKEGQYNAQSRDKLLTLSLSLQQAQLLALAVDKGRLSVAVRSPRDPSVVDSLPDLKSSALFDTAAREQVQQTRPAAVAARDGAGREQPIKIEGVKR
jgi:pilus assembly protein CpaB